jgi:GNAT superfamily N-acetyltransferase
VLKNENALRQLAIKYDSEISTEIRAIIANCQFWADCQHIVTILHLLMAVICSLETNSATLADCHKELLTLAAAIDNVVVGPASFAGHCMAAFCRRWSDLDDEIYMLAYFLHPGMHGKGIASALFTNIAETAVVQWKDFGNGKQSTMKLLSQLMKYKSGEMPYNLPIAGDLITPCFWWQSMEDSIGQELKTLAIRLLSVTPHSAACERTFSILGWIHTKSRNRLLTSRLEAMGKLYICITFHIRRLIIILLVLAPLEYKRLKTLHCLTMGSRMMKTAQKHQR